ncbi:MAG: peptidase M22 [Clostridia bacterium]|nr:peptidase M22 [Clostridia bacterium]
MSLILGVDTSNYTTSLAAVDIENGSVFQAKKLLPVAEGALGLRQSDAVFHHTVQLPQLFDELELQCDLTSVRSVGVSVTPRSEEGSYMPCFLAGVSAATAFAASRSLPVMKFSHQQGHIVAALFSADKLELLNEKFLAFHVSGGTTEAVIVTPDSEKICKTELVASSLDLKAGQAVDRVGVAMRLRFPAGRQLDELASRCDDKFKIKPVLRGCDCSLSGVENKCKKMLADGEPKEKVARYCIEYICASLDAMVVALAEKYGKMPIVFSGGVMSNSIISKKLSEKYGAYFAKPEFSCDNAVGTAVLASIMGKKI